MYVCLCKGITDSQIQEAVLNGASSMDDLGKALGVAQGCGSCSEFAEAILHKNLHQNTDIDSKLYYKVA